MVESISGKVIVITGASNGIGAATATLLAERGAKVVLGARSTESLSQVADRIAQSGAEVKFIATDVRKREDLVNLVDLAVQSFGRLDVMVNNAGIMPTSRLDALRVEDWEDMIDTNLKGVLYGIAAAMPVFMDQGSGHIVNVASTAAHIVAPTMAVYSATKMGVLAISDGLRQESGQTVRVSVVSPGITNTNFAAGVTDLQLRAQLEQRRDTNSLPPTAVAQAIAFAIEQPDSVDVGEIIVRASGWIDAAHQPPS